MSHIFSTKTLKSNKQNCAEQLESVKPIGYLRINYKFNKFCSFFLLRNIHLQQPFRLWIYHQVF